MEYELVLRMMDCIADIKTKIERALEAAKRDVDRTHCRIQDDTIAKWENTVVAMQSFVAPYEKSALEYREQWKGLAKSNETVRLACTNTLQPEPKTTK